MLELTDPQKLGDILKAIPETFPLTTLPQSNGDRQRSPKTSQKAGAQSRIIADLAPSADEDCSICEGKGWLSVQIEDHIFMAEPCECLLHNWLRSRGAPEALQTHGLDKQLTFSTFQVFPENKAALDAAIEFAEGRAKYLALFIYGGTGCGKSHLCNSVAVEALGRGLDVRHYSVPQLTSELRLRMAEGMAEKLISEVKETSLLVLDDWGLEYGSEWEESRLEEIMVERFRSYRLTLIASNKSPDSLPERVRSRFMDKNCAKIVGNMAADYRKANRGQQ